MQSAEGFVLLGVVVALLLISLRYFICYGGVRRSGWVWLGLVMSGALCAPAIGDVDKPHEAKPWVGARLAAYTGLYHFGESEGESTLRLVVDGTKVYAQIRSGDFEFSEKGTAWVWKYENLRDVRIVAGRFYSNKSNGAFVRYETATGAVLGLDLEKPWSPMLSEDAFAPNFGAVTRAIASDYERRFVQASIKRIAQAELKRMGLAELQLMRNEIFARYGFIFQQGGAMRAYFDTQPWYHARHKNVNALLTGLEKDNISALLLEEKHRLSAASRSAKVRQAIAWLEGSVLPYQGVYTFGLSEKESADESRLRIIVDGDQVFAQLVTYKVPEDGSDWILSFENLRNVRIAEGRFYSDKSNGAFIQYDAPFPNCFGLKLDDPWTPAVSETKWTGRGESMRSPGAIEQSYHGQFAQASTERLTQEQLQGMGLSDLQLMRNEIFARYGYLFQQGGKMRAYFDKQPWYLGQHENVDAFLTPLEKDNVHTIRLVEKQRETAL